MAYTPAPLKETYNTHRVAIATDIMLRANSLSNSNDEYIQQDAGLVNLIPIKEGKELTAITRMYIDTATQGSTFAGNVRGVYVWEKSVGTVYYFCVVDQDVYTSTDGITFAVVNTLTTNADTPVRFTEFLNDSNVKSLIMVDGVQGFVFTTNAAGTEITDGDFPTPHVPFPIFLDGYLFLAKANTGDIYNCDLNDPTAWTAGSFISAEMYPEDIQALAKVNNYLLAIGTQSCEYFYDAAVATASPLARLDGASLPFGTLIPNSIAVNKNTLTMVANNNDGSATLMTIENQKYKDMDSGFIVPMLNARLSLGNISVAGIRAYYFRQRSEIFYGLCFSAQDTTDLASPTVSPTLVYSFSTDMWTEFRLNIDGTASFPVAFSHSATTASFGTFVVGNLGTASSYFGVLREGTGAAYGYDTIGEFVYPIYQEFRTANLDFDTLNVKSMNRLGIEMESGESDLQGAAGNIYIYWSDDDYKSWSTVRTLDASTTASGINTYYPFITQLGMFRRRAIKGVYKGARFMRFRGLEIDINKGQQ